ncbi:alpha/beta fold hydrolase [Natrinema halophilum]|uniref:alpha/beta fold hydrolase n=1 Tax=Natrinema halophilum TaxID=1699371 RepID=UPI003CCCD639
MVLVHTAGAEGRQWRYVGPKPAQAGYHVFVPDLPGHGTSYPSTGCHTHAFTSTPNSSGRSFRQLRWSNQSSLVVQSAGYHPRCRR